MEKEIEFYRICPKCGEKIFHKNQRNLNRSILRNAACHKCAAKEIGPKISATKMAGKDPVKKCFRCKGPGPFYSDKSKKDGLSSTCQQCKKDNTKSWYNNYIKSGLLPHYVEDKDKIKTRGKLYRKLYATKLRDKSYQSKYGITLSEFELMCASQNHCCAICGGQMVIGGKHANTACVDHCHATNKIRGILCSLCNKALGSLHDNINSARRLVSYLEDSISSQQRVPVSHQEKLSL
jgi:hypothetical protein